MNAPPVSPLGLGRMGEPIARRLLGALGSLTVWNRTTAKAAALGQAGAERLAGDGIGVVDAPLSGGVAGAESGALSVMVGGSDDAVGRVWPVLTLVGSTVRHLGPSGAREVAKACNQVVVAATVTALSEALVLADAGGIDRAELLELLGGGLAGSEVLRQKRDRWLSGEFHGGGSSANQLKDLRFVTETASARGLTLPLATTGVTS